MVKVKIGIAVLLTAAMGTFGVGCSNPPSQYEEQSIGNFFAFIILQALCSGTAPPNCPLPGLPVPVTPAP